MKYLYNYYYSVSIQSIANNLGYVTLPNFIIENTIAILMTSTCSNGQYALSDYIITSVGMLVPTTFETVLQSYISLYTSISPTNSAATFNVVNSDDSRVLWADFKATPSAVAGVFTFFPSRSEKLSNYNNFYSNIANDEIVVNGFAHVAAITIYHQKVYSACTSVPLRITNEILQGIYTGSIIYWNDTLIQNANSGYESCLPYNLITIVAYSVPSDSNSIFIRYLNLISPKFQSLYSASGGDTTYRYFNFSTIIPANRLILINENKFVDNVIIAEDNSIGYYLQVNQPTSNIADYCSDNNCVLPIINPSDNGVSIELCAQDLSTIINPSKLIYTYDLMLSSAAGCYPIVGTIDYVIFNIKVSTTSSASAMNSNVQYNIESDIDSNIENEILKNDIALTAAVKTNLIKQKIQLGAFLFNGSAVTKSSSVISLGVYNLYKYVHNVCMKRF